MEFVNNETGKTVATLPDITKADEKAWEKVTKERKRVAKEWGAKIKKETAEEEAAIKTEEVTGLIEALRLIKEFMEEN